MTHCTYVFLCFRSDSKLMVVFSILKCFLFPLIACFVPFSLGKGFSKWTLDLLESLFKPSTCDRNLQKCASLAVQNSEFHRFGFQISQLLDAFAVRNGLRLERPSIPTQVPAESRDSASIIISYSSQSILISTNLSSLSCISDLRASKHKPLIPHNWQAVSFFCWYFQPFFHLFFTIFSPLFSTNQLSNALPGQLSSARISLHMLRSSNLPMGYGFEFDACHGRVFYMALPENQGIFVGCFIYPFNKDLLIQGGIRNNESTLKM